MSTILYLNNRQLCDLELLLNGGFSPLEGYMNSKDYYSCLHNMTLADGSVWPIPVTLASNENYNIGDIITLKDMTGIALATLTVDDIYKPDLMEECKYVLGSDDTNHPYHSIIMENKDKNYIGGKVTRITLPLHYDFMNLRMTPDETKQYFKNNNWDTIVGFQTRNPMHRSHFELTQFALKEVGNDAKLLLHPVVGVTQDCDIDYHTRVRCYKKLVSKYKDATVLLSLLPLSMRMAGPREELVEGAVRLEAVLAEHRDFLGSARRLGHRALDDDLADADMRELALAEYVGTAGAVRPDRRREFLGVTLVDRDHRGA